MVICYFKIINTELLKLEIKSLWRCSWIIQHLVTPDPLFYVTQISMGTVEKMYKLQRSSMPF